LNTIPITRWNLYRIRGKNEKMEGRVKCKSLYFALVICWASVFFKTIIHLKRWELLYRGFFFNEFAIVEHNIRCDSICLRGLESVKMLVSELIQLSDCVSTPSPGIIIFFNYSSIYIHTQKYDSESNKAYI